MILKKEETREYRMGYYNKVKEMFNEEFVSEFFDKEKTLHQLCRIIIRQLFLDFNLHNIL